MSNKPVYVLGTGLNHDGSTCLLKDGRVCVAIEKERLTRTKHDGYNDADAIRYCLDAEGITLDDLTLVVQSALVHHMERGNEYFFGPRPFGAHSPVPVVTISHHLAHAYSAVGMSPFDSMSVLVIDGCGSTFDVCQDREGATVPEQPRRGLGHLFREKDSFYCYEAGRLTPLYKDFSPLGMGRGHPMEPAGTLHSIGSLYEAVSAYCFGNLEDTGKLMGLSPYGRPGVFAGEIFELRDGRVFVRYDWMEKFNSPASSFETLRENFQYYADIAHWVQREIERAVLYVVNARYPLAAHDRLAYCGGVALNAVANSLIISSSPYRELFVVPAAGDGGLALGCAWYGWLAVLGRERVRHDGSSCFGKVYPASAVVQALDSLAAEEAAAAKETVLRASPERAKFRLRRVKDLDYVETTADLLAAGAIVGWFQGGAEFGPRALGRRSILADPRNPGVRDFINRHIKLREDFRPFAPSVLLEDAAEYFHTASESPYMILVSKVRAEWRHALRSVVHEDDTSRIQTVREEWNPTFYRLLRAFKKRTGISVLLNTSFNRRGMPIVETPSDAAQFFVESMLHCLVIDEFILWRMPEEAETNGR